MDVATKPVEQSLRTGRKHRRVSGRISLDPVRPDRRGKSADMGRTGVGDIEHLFVRREGKPVRLHAARYGKLVRNLFARNEGPVPEELAWAAVESEMLTHHVRRRLSEQLDGVSHGPEGSLDKLLMTWVEQSVGHAALAVTGTRDPDL